MAIQIVQNEKLNITIDDIARFKNDKPCTTQIYNKIGILS